MDQSKWFSKSGVHKSRATDFCEMAPNIYGSPVWTLLDIALLAHRILRWFLAPCKIYAPLLYTLRNNAVIDHGQDYLGHFRT